MSDILDPLTLTLSRRERGSHSGSAVFSLPLRGRAGVRGVNQHGVYAFHYRIDIAKYFMVPESYDLVA